MTDEELENTIIRQAADMQESPLVGQQYIFFLGAPTDDVRLMHMNSWVGNSVRC